MTRPVEVWRCLYCHEVLPDPDVSCRKPECIAAFTRSMERMRDIDVPTAEQLQAEAEADRLAMEQIEADVQFRCETEEPDPFPGHIICGMCGGRGCVDCEHAGYMVMP